jgi:uncharacterized protein (TIGR02001 family)
MRVAMGLLVGALGLAAAGTAQAQDNKLGIPGALSGAFGFTSDYMFRGISQTSSDPAVQGSLEYSVETGFRDTSVYLSAWGSNVKFTDASIEIDVAAGVRGSLAGITYDIGPVFYAYPGAADNLNYDFWEAGLRLGYDFGIAAVVASVYYSPDFFAASGNATYYQVGVDVPLPFSVTLGARYGHQSIDNNVRFGSPDYSDWNIGVSREFLTIVWDLRYFDTDLTRAECAGTGNCDSRVELMATKKF